MGALCGKQLVSLLHSARGPSSHSAMICGHLLHNSPTRVTVRDPLQDGDLTPPLVSACGD